MRRLVGDALGLRKFDDQRFAPCAAGYRNELFYIDEVAVDGADDATVFANVVADSQPVDFAMVVLNENPLLAS